MANWAIMVLLREQISSFVISAANFAIAAGSQDQVLIRWIPLNAGVRCFIRSLKTCNWPARVSEIPNLDKWIIQIFVGWNNQNQLQFEWLFMGFIQAKPCKFDWIAWVCSCFQEEWKLVYSLACPKRQWVHFLKLKPKCAKSNELRNLFVPRNSANSAVCMFVWTSWIERLGI